MNVSNRGFSWALAAVALAFISGAPSASADEGMWTFNAFPTAKVAAKYGFTATPKWLEHARLSSARLAGGCSGSFVSREGLVMTNHHCAHSCIEQLSHLASNHGTDYVAQGFFAKTRADEPRCPEIEVNRLLEITDVTARVNAATSGRSGAAFQEALQGAMSSIEKECAGGSDELRCDVTTLYRGGKYELYKYRRYQDVRLVFAPEIATAFFGGDPDNFMFPRYDLDLSFLRVYDHGKPLANDEYFHWSSRPAGDGDLTFVTGHPGKTSRSMTVAELEFERDIRLIHDLLYLSELRGVLTGFVRRGAEERRMGESELFYIENGYKVRKGQLEALTSGDVMPKKRQAEAQLRARVRANASLQRELGSAWDEIAAAKREHAKMYEPLAALERNRNMLSRYFYIAKTLVRGAAELPKPNEKRLREFADSALPALKQELFSEAPIHEALEIEMLTFHLTKLREMLTPDHPAVRRILGERSPAELAEAIVHGTKLRDVSLRKSLFEGGARAIEASTDPMIMFMRTFEVDARAIRKRADDTIEPALKRNDERVARAQFAIHGMDNYPDATFTLRVSYGQIRGYQEAGHAVAPLTTFEGAFKRNTGREPFALPASWLNARQTLAMDTPLDFCSTNDIIGGNSGSPVINRDAEVVGLIFDGNIQSLGNDFGFDETVSRAIAVHSSAITEALRKIYHADRIVEELLPSAH